MSIFTLDIDPDGYGSDVPDEPHLFVADQLEKIALHLRRNGGDAEDGAELHAGYGQQKVGEWSYEPPVREFLVTIEMTIEAMSEDDATTKAEESASGSDVTDFNVVNVETN